MDFNIDYSNAILPNDILKKKGLEYLSTGILIPFTSEDANGLLLVEAALNSGVLETNMKFSNGSTMLINASVLPDFKTWFFNNRNTYF